jgi:methyltransferase
VLTRRHAVTAAVGALAAQRLAELVVSRRHEQALRQSGAVEHGAGHHPVMVALHAGWLASTLIEARRTRRPLPVAAVAVAAATFVGAQGLRYWAITTLGDRWTTRVLVPPASERVTSGPYRWLDHPNYLAVALEIASFPVLLGAPRTAAVFSIADAALLTVRIRAEDAALSG